MKVKSFQFTSIGGETHPDENDKIVNQWLEEHALRIEIVAVTQSQSSFISVNETIRYTIVTYKILYKEVRLP